MEIDIKDLMVGSLVLTPKWGVAVVGKISGGGEVNLFVPPSDAYHSDVPVETLQPIPVSEEWLVKLGFITNGKKEIVHAGVGDYYLYRSETQNGYIVTLRIEGHSIYSAGVEFVTSVHHLQALFWHLCRVELTLP